MIKDVEAKRDAVVNQGTCKDGQYPLVELTIGEVNWLIGISKKWELENRHLLKEVFIDNLRMNPSASHAGLVDMKKIAKMLDIPLKG